MAEDRMRCIRFAGVIDLLERQEIWIHP
jgi:hypothetical protein